MIDNNSTTKKLVLCSLCEEVFETSYYAGVCKLCSIKRAKIKFLRAKYGFDERFETPYDHYFLKASVPQYDKFLRSYSRQDREKTLVNIGEERKPFKPDIVFGEDGWISPTGQYFACENYRHRFKAKQIVQTFFLKNLSLEILLDEFKIDTWLQENNWIKVANGNFQRYSKTFPITIAKKQLDTIFDFLESKDRLQKSLSFNNNKFKDYFSFFRTYDK